MHSPKPNSQDVLQLRGSVHIEHTLARMGAERLWRMLSEGGDSYVHALGALTGACVDLDLISLSALVGLVG